MAVAGAELGDLSTSILEALRQHCDTSAAAVTIEEYRGQFEKDTIGRIAFKAPAYFLANTGASFPRIGMMDSEWALLCVAKQENRGKPEDRMNLSRVMALTAARVLLEKWAPPCGKVTTSPELANLYDKAADKRGLQFFSVGFTVQSDLEGTFTDAEITDFMRAHGEAFMTDDQDDGSITAATELQTP